MDKANLNKMIHLHKKGNFLELRDFSEKLLEKDPLDSVIMIFLGIAHFEQKNYYKAVKTLSEAVAIDPNNLEANINLGNAYGKLNDYNNAMRCYEKSIKIQPDYYKIYYNLGIIMEKIGRLDEAIREYRKAIKIHDGYSMAYNNLGNILQTKGNIKEATDCYKKAISFDSECAEAYRHLGRIIKYKTYDSKIKFMEKFFSKSSSSNNQKMHLGFALGEAFADIKKYEKSFYYFQQGNNLRRNFLSYSINNDIAKWKMIKKIFESNKLQKKRSSIISKITPIFIVGMLRSGTSLTEQILASHSKVFGAGEIGKFIELIEEKNKLLNINESSLKKLGKEYLNYLKKLSPSQYYFTDKMPLNFMWVGFIKAAIPNAKIINCVRDPKDTCLSIYKNYFVKDANEYAYNLEELGKFYNLYSEIMAYWHKVFPACIYDISYESLVKHQEKETKNLLNKCGLNFEENCLKYYKTNRNVQTASSYQVRKPMYKDSIGSWKNYKKDIQILIKLLNNNKNEKHKSNRSK